MNKSPEERQKIRGQLNNQRSRTDNLAKEKRTKIQKNPARHQQQRRENNINQRTFEKNQRPTNTPNRSRTNNRRSNDRRSR